MNITRVVSILAKLILFGVCVFFIILSIEKFSFVPFSGAKELGYPAPILQSTKMMSAYPDPITTQSPVTQQPMMTIASQKTIDPRMTLDPKMNFTPSASQISAQATTMFERAQPYTPLPQKPGYSLKISSITELNKIVYNHPVYSMDNMVFSPCIKKGTPLPALYIESLNNLPGYYILPFVKDKIVCGLAVIEYDGTRGIVGGWSTFNDEKFPSVSQDEASSLVAQKTFRKVTAKPVLVWSKFRESYDYFNPFWKVGTDDGQIYYVIFLAGMTEEGQYKKDVKILNANEMHVIK